jgi:hypothetical protein
MNLNTISLPGEGRPTTIKDLIVLQMWSFNTNGKKGFPEDLNFLLLRGERNTNTS